MDYKIVLTGLENAGKTSILRVLDDDLDDARPVQPTKGLQASKMRVLGLELFRWDLGGQLKYREKYLQEVPRFFGNARLVVFVISVSEQATHKKALKFLRRLVDAPDWNAGVHVSVFLHKADPEWIARPGSRATMVALTEKVDKVLEGIPHSFWETSIKVPREVHMAFSLSMMRGFPRGEYLPDFLKDTVGKLGGSMAAVHALGTEDENPFLFGRYVEPRSQIQLASAFLEKTHEVAVDPEVPVTDVPAGLPLSKATELVYREIRAGPIRVLFTLLLPRGMLWKDPQLRASYASAVERLEKLLETITAPFRVLATS